MNYVKLYTDALYSYKRLSDTEFGRALRAVLQYAEDGTEPNLPGKECIMFDVLREQVERDRAAYNTKVENGKKGGRPPKKKENLKNRAVISDSKKTERNQDKDKEKYIPPYNPPTGDDYDEEAMIAQNELLNEVFDKARDSGFRITQASMGLLSDRLHDYGKETLFYALDKCVKAQAFNFGYLDTVLGNKPKEAIQAPSKPHDYAADYL